MLINEIAKLAGLSKDGIRHYEEIGLITSTPREAGSKIYREYDASVLDTIEKIRGAQRLGFSLKEIGPLLKIYAENPPSKERAVKFLTARLAVIREKIASLREVEDYICGKLENYGEETEKKKTPPLMPGQPETHAGEHCTSSTNHRETGGERMITAKKKAKTSKVVLSTAPGSILSSATRRPHVPVRKG